jgi:hypothetical protein
MWFLATRRKLDIFLFSDPRVCQTRCSFIIRQPRKAGRKLDLKLHSPLILHLQFLALKDRRKFFTRDTDRLVKIDNLFFPTQCRIWFNEE